MCGESKQAGITLTEMTVVIAVVAMLFGLALPTARVLINSFESQAGTKAMIEAAFASARAMAAKEQRYAGVRFQKVYHPGGPTKAEQYMIFIVNEEPRKIGNLIRRTGFRAVEGVAPIKLAGSVGVMDLMLRTDGIKPADVDIDEDVELRDTSAFSIVFSPGGKLAIHDVRVRNRDGKTEGSAIASMDEIFNTESKVTNLVNPVGMFIQDDFPLLGLEEEPSRNSFVIYDRAKFNEVYRRGSAWTGYLEDLSYSRFYINPYTGRIIDK